jgi:hypothetical protein
MQNLTTRLHFGVLAVVPLMTIAALPAPVFSQKVTAEKTKAESEANEVQRRADEEAKAYQRRLVKEFASRVQESCTLLGELESKSKKYFDRTNSLLTDDDGKKLATDPSAFLHYIDVQKSPPFTFAQVTAKKELMESLSKELNAELDRPNVGYLPSEERKTETEQAFAWTRQMLGTVAAEQGWLDTVISKATASPVEVKKAKSLQDVIRDYNALRIQLATQARLEIEIALRPEAQKIASDSAATNFLERARFDAEQTTLTLRAELEKQRIDDEIKTKRLIDVQEQRITDLNRQLADAKAARLKQDAASDATARKGEMDADEIRKRQQCHDPEVKRVLAPLLANGYWQPGDRDFEPSSIDAKPISLSKLRAAGALTRDSAGIKKLYEIGQVVHGTKDRSVRWGFRQFEYMPPEEFEQLKLAQKYLNDLGSALVQEGMLEP